jgi:hypothetical protein
VVTRLLGEGLDSLSESRLSRECGLGRGSLGALELAFLVLFVFFVLFFILWRLLATGLDCPHLDVGFDRPHLDVGFDRPHLDVGFDRPHLDLRNGRRLPLLLLPRLSIFALGLTLILLFLTDTALSAALSVSSFYGVCVCWGFGGGITVWRRYSIPWKVVEQSIQVNTALRHRPLCVSSFGFLTMSLQASQLTVFVPEDLAFNGVRLEGGGHVQETILCEVMRESGKWCVQIPR